MGGELLDVDLCGRRETLGAQRVVPERHAFRILEQGQAMLARVLFEVTSGGVFWMVAVGPARWAMRVFLLGSSRPCPLLGWMPFASLLPSIGIVSKRSAVGGGTLQLCAREVLGKDCR